MTGHDRAREYIRSNIDVAVRSGYGDDLDLYIALEQQVLGEFYNQSKAFQADELAAFRKILFESVANQQALESTWNDVTP